MTTEPSNPVSPPAAVHLPEPTLWPAALGLGSSLLLWGMISSLILTLIGAVVFAVAVWGWIGEIRHERQKHGPEHGH